LWVNEIELHVSSTTTTTTTTVISVVVAGEFLVLVNNKTDGKNLPLRVVGGLAAAIKNSATQQYSSD
jgi:hypothetical protein